MSKLELRNPVGPQRIPAEIPLLSYEEGSQQAGRPSGPQSLATHPTRLRLATTLRMRALHVESAKCGVCLNFHRVGGGVFLGVNGTSADLEKSVWCQVVVDRPSHVAV
jgi:hypothetical protein